MRPADQWPDGARQRVGPYGSDPGDDFGCFVFRSASIPSHRLLVLASSGAPDVPWEHVSVSAWRLEQATRQWHPVTPTWDEMCQVKAAFWGDEESVVQFHPRKSDYINHAPNCLHLWRHKHCPIELPPKGLVGPVSE